MATKEIKFKGMRELTKMLREFPLEVRVKVLKRALRAGAKIVKEEAKSNVSVRTGKLRDGIKVSVKVKDDQAIASVKTTGKHGFLGNWIEHGTAAHKIVAAEGRYLLIHGKIWAESVDHPGAGPKPFIRPALETKASQAILAVGEVFKRSLKRGKVAGAGQVFVEMADEGDDEGAEE